MKVAGSWQVGCINPSEVYMFAKTVSILALRLFKIDKQDIFQCTNLANLTRPWQSCNQTVCWWLYIPVNWLFLQCNFVKARCCLINELLHVTQTKEQLQNNRLMTNEWRVSFSNLTTERHHLHLNTSKIRSMSVVRTLIPSMLAIVQIGTNWSLSIWEIR